MFNVFALFSWHIAQLSQYFCTSTYCIKSDKSTRAIQKIENPEGLKMSIRVRSAKWEPSQMEPEQQNIEKWRFVYK